MTEQPEHREASGLQAEHLTRLWRSLQAAREEMPELLSELPDDLAEELLSDDEARFERAIDKLKLRALQQPETIPDWALPASDPPGEFDTVDLGNLDTLDLGKTAPPPVAGPDGGGEPEQPIPPVAPAVFPLMPEHSPDPDPSDEPAPTPREQLLAYRRWQRERRERP